MAADGLLADPAKAGHGHAVAVACTDSGPLQWARRRRRTGVGESCLRTGWTPAPGSPPRPHRDCCLSHPARKPLVIVLTMEPQDPEQPLAPASRSRASRFATIAACLLLASMFAMFAATSLRARFVMDEFGLLQGARYLLQAPLYHGVDPIKTVLATSVYAPLTKLDSALTMVLAARLLGLLAACGSLLLVYQAARALWPRSYPAPLAVLLALSFSNYFERAFRIRTDTLALPFALGAFLLLVRPRPCRWHAPVAGMLLGVAFLCTQKAIYFLAAFLFALVAARWSSNGWRSALRNGFGLALGWAVAFLLYSVWFGGWKWWSVVLQVLLGPRYIFSGTGSYAGLDSFIYQTLTRNLVPYGLSLVGLLITVVGWRRVGTAQRFAALATAGTTLLVFIHTQPWPYVFVWAQVFLALWVVPLVERLAARPHPIGRHAPMIAVALAALSLPRQIRYLDHDNHLQLQVLAQAERLLAPTDRYFDGIGMVVNRSIAGSYPWWSWEVPNLHRMVAALNKGDDRLPREIVAAHPKLWIINYRLDAVAGLVDQMVAGGYVRISPAILLTGTPWPAGAETQEFACRWPGRYRLYDATGHPVDEPFRVGEGAPAQVVAIQAGLHRLRRTGNSEIRFLLPEGTVVTGPIPAVGPPPDLYAKVYTF